LGLKDKIQFPEEAAVGQTRKVKSLVMERLRGNVEVDVQGRWQEVTIALMLPQERTH
jgi:ubiquinone biosynthesis protein COQ9